MLVLSFCRKGINVKKVVAFQLASCLIMLVFVKISRFFQIINKAKTPFMMFNHAMFAFCWEIIFRSETPALFEGIIKISEKSFFLSVPGPR
jgi:hypothetical protein